MVLYICLFQNIMFAFMPEDDFEYFKHHNFLFSVKLYPMQYTKMNELRKMVYFMYIH